MKYRVEKKYLCSEQQLQILEARLRSIMSYDKNLEGRNRYLIRSIYFDDYEDRFFSENEGGVDSRCKYRIRAYDCDQKSLRLEIKHKYRGYCYKEQCKLDLDTFQSIMQRRLDHLQVSTNKTWNQFYLETATRLLHPAIIVEYERTAFVYSIGNVRITFDRNIGYSDRFDKFFDSDLPITEIMPLNQHILEVKYDELLPDYIAQLLEIKTLEQCTFSKYFLTRQMYENYH